MITLPPDHIVGRLFLSSVIYNYIVAFRAKRRIFFKFHETNFSQKLATAV